MPAPDDLGGCGRSRLCRARIRRRHRRARGDHGRRRKIPSRQRPNDLNLPALFSEIAPSRCGATPAITFARGKAGAIDSVAGSGNIHASASTLDAHPIYHGRNAPMIDLYYWSTPNGHKIMMFLEETGLAYKVFPINIGKGDQFKPEFLAVAPNNRIPALVDHEPKGGGKPISIFESGAMLLYLAEKTGKFLPADTYGRYDTIQWTFWQMGGLGPMAGQNHHFSNYAQEKIKYAIDRYVNETNRLYGVLNKRLADRAFIAGDYSIADMASYPWVVGYKNQSQNIDDFPHLKRWLETIRERPATVRAYAKAKEVNPNFGQPVNRTEEERKLLFGQTAAVVK
jgi:GST-like protein